MFDLVNTEDVRFLECPRSNIFGELNVSGFDSTVDVNQFLSLLLSSEQRTDELPSVQSCR